MAIFLVVFRQNPTEDKLIVISKYLTRVEFINSVGVGVKTPFYFVCNVRPYTERPLGFRGVQRNAQEIKTD